MDRVLQIQNHKRELIQAVQNKESIVITEDGTWYTRSFISQLFRRILGLFITVNDALETAEQLGRYLSTSLVEVKKGDVQGLSASRTWAEPEVSELIQAAVTAIKETCKEEERAIHKLKVASRRTELSATEIIKLNRKARDGDSWRARTAAATLKRSGIMHHYLNVPQSEINKTQVNSTHEKWLERRLKEWQKQTYPVIDYFSEDRKVGTLKKLERCCQYPEFIKAARENGALLDSFFNSLFRKMANDLPSAVDFYIQMPTLHKNFSRAFLDTRIAQVKTRIPALQFSEEGVCPQTTRPIKDVKLLVHNELQSISVPDRLLTFSEKVKISVRDLFAKCEEQNYTFIDKEMFETGLEDFDPRLLNVDVTDKDWWKKLPVMERLSRAEIEKRYGVPFATGHALFALRASRTTPDRNVEDCHAWADLLVPLDDGTFNVLSIGKFSERFPLGFLETFLFIFRTHKGQVTISDFNKFYCHRDKVAVPFPPLTQEQFTTFMDKLKEDIQASKAGALIFQAQGDNCATYAEQLAMRLYPELSGKAYDISFENVVLPPPLMSLVEARHYFPNSEGWNTFRNIVCFLFGAWQSYEYKKQNGATTITSLLDNPIWRNGTMKLPAQLFEQKKEIMGTLWKDYEQSNRTCVQTT